MELSQPTFTVVVSNDDEDGLIAGSLAEQWRRDGLLTEFAWVTPGDVQRSSFGPPVVWANVVGGDEQVELMTLLGARPRALIRIVVLHLLTHEDSAAERLVHACNEIAELVLRAMPRQVGESATSVRLLRINLLVPESDLLPQSAGLIERTWEVNALVSPEDRPDLDRMSVFVRKATNLHGHGLAAVAAVGGLWTGSPVGAFDSYERDSTSGGDEIHVIRCQARLVVDDDRSQQLAGSVVDTVQSSPTGAATMLGWGIPADDPDAATDKTVTRLLTDPEWAPQERRHPPLEKAQVSLGSIIRNWAVFQLQLPASIVRYLLGIGRSAVERTITAATVGRGAGEVGRVRPLTPDEARQVAEFRLQALAEQYDPSRLRDEASAWGQATPAAWRQLRELALGLVDGSRLPSGFVRASRGGLEEVLAPAAVVPPSDDTLSIAGSPAVAHIDVAGVATLAEKLMRQAAERQAAASPQANPEAQKDKTTPELSELTRWVDRRKTTLLWRLTSKVYEFRRREGAQAQAAERTLIGTTPPSTRGLKVAQMFVLGSWIFCFAGLLVLALWGWAAPRQGIFEWVPDFDWLNVGKYVVLLLAVLLVAGTIYFQRLRAYEWAVLQRMHSMNIAGDEFVAASQQEKRWALMYAGLQDWGTILAELLHSPWAEAPKPAGYAASYDGLPASVAVAKPIEAEFGIEARVISLGVESVCGRGWLVKEFNQLVSHSPANDPRAQPHAGGIPADLDLGLRRRGPRRELVELATLETTKVAATLSLQEGIAELVSQGDVQMPPQTVVRVGPYSAGDKVADRDFLVSSVNRQAPFVAELFTPSAQVERFHVPERSVFCLPPGCLSEGLGAAEVHRVGTSVSTRVDISTLVRTGDVSFFAGPSIESRAMVPAEVFDDYN